MKEKNQIKNVYVADFETSTGEYVNNTDVKETYVWAYGLVNIWNENTLKIGSSIQEFFEMIEKLPHKSIVYFHNLKFDGNFIIWWLLKQQFREVMDSKDIPPYSFSPLVSDIGIWYSIKVKFQNREITFFDSFKKLPFPVAVLAKNLGYECKGDIDYHKKREIGAKIDEEDYDYIRRDVCIVARALREICYENGLTKQTIGSDCFSYFKKTVKNYRNLFPKLDDVVYEYLQNGYKGGYVYVNKKIQNKVLNKNGKTYDYNSMYPSVMHSQSGYKYPVGMPEYYEGQYKEDPFMPLYVQRFKATFQLKDKHVPIVQIKNSIMYEDTEYLEVAEEPVELYMCNIDLELFFKHYDVTYYEPIDGYKFVSTKGVFDEYIDRWFAMKEESTISGNRVERMLSKLMLNNLYGKFGQSNKADKKSFKEGLKRLEGEVVEDKRNTTYIPVAIFTTAYARKELLTAIQENYDKFCYCDTDSMHLLDEAKGIKVHNSKLGYWKHESDWTQAKFIRAKTYCELIDGKLDVKCAGMPSDVKDKITIKQFKKGAVFNGKLTMKQVLGGVILEETTFKIR